jgi:hypothetical protein
MSKHLMRMQNISTTKKIVLVLFALGTLASLSLLIYALVYATAESAYRKYAIVIGLLFILFVRLTLSSYKNVHETKALN